MHRRSQRRDWWGLAFVFPNFQFVLTYMHTHIPHTQAHTHIDGSEHASTKQVLTMCLDGTGFRKTDLLWYVFGIYICAFNPQWLSIIDGQNFWVVSYESGSMTMSRYMPHILWRYRSLQQP